MSTIIGQKRSEIDLQVRLSMSSALVYCACARCGHQRMAFPPCLVDSSSRGFCCLTEFRLSAFILYIISYEFYFLDRKIDLWLSQSHYFQRQATILIL